MCGLTGIAGDFGTKEKDVFLDLLLLTQLRGKDSTGVFSIRNDNSGYYAKRLGTPDVLLDSQSFNSKVLLGLPKVLAGHCRSKTVGDNTQENAHPYSLENVVGMHNGTLRAPYQMPGHDHKRTDSYTLYKLIDERGLEEAMKEVDPDGAWALVWWDFRDMTLNFLRNSLRPLWFAWTKDKRGMLWASEPWMFGAADRKIDLWDGKNKEGEPGSPYFSLPENQWWSFSVDGSPGKDKSPLTLHPIKTIVPPPKAVTTYSPPYRTPWDWQKKDEEEGGEGTPPFTMGAPAKAATDSLDDPLDDLSGKPSTQLLLPAIPDILKTPGGSPTSSTTAGKSGSHSSNVSDFRAASMRGMSSSRQRLSLVPKVSKLCPPDSSEKPSGTSKPSTLTARPRSLTSVRQVLNLWYITDNKTGREVTAIQFERETGGASCSFCEEPIGDLNEVHEIFAKGTRFVCTSCADTPKVAISQ